MDCAACARKVETAASQVAGVKQAKVLFATEKLLVEADEDIRAQVEKAVTAAGYTLRSEDEPQPEVPESRLKENLPLIALVVMMAISWGWSSLITPSAISRLSSPRWLGYTHHPPGAAPDEKRQLVRH